VWFEGAVRPVDAVDVWPMLMGTNNTAPRPWTPTSDYGIVWGQYKLVTLAGQSNYYTNTSDHVNPNGTVLPCLEGAQHHSGRPTDSPVSGCVVCNITQPCLFDMDTDAAETTNIATDFPDVVAKLAAKLAEYQPYGNFDMNSTQLAKYKSIDPSRWEGYAGPCLEPNDAPPAPPAPPSPPPSPPAPPSPPKPCSTCSFEQNMHYRGNDIEHTTAASPQACCDACNGNNDCVKFVYVTHTSACMLKSKGGKGSRYSGYVSGSCGSV